VIGPAQIACLRRTAVSVTGNDKPGTPGVP